MISGSVSTVTFPRVPRRPCTLSFNSNHCFTASVDKVLKIDRIAFNYFIAPINSAEDGQPPALGSGFPFQTREHTSQTITILTSRALNPNTHS
jgi:hypothetical protein